MAKPRKVKPGEVKQVVEAVAAAQQAGKAIPEILKELHITQHRYAYLRSLHRRENGKSDNGDKAVNRNGVVRQLETEVARLQQERDAALAEVTQWQARYGQLAAKHLA